MNFHTPSASCPCYHPDIVTTSAPSGNLRTFCALSWKPLRHGQCPETSRKRPESVRKVARHCGQHRAAMRNKSGNTRKPCSRCWSCAEAMPKVSRKRGADAELYKTARWACILICGQEAEWLTYLLLVQHNQHNFFLYPVLVFKVLRLSLKPG